MLLCLPLTIRSALGPLLYFAPSNKPFLAVLQPRNVETIARVSCLVRAQPSRSLILRPARVRDASGFRGRPPCVALTFSDGDSFDLAGYLEAREPAYVPPKTIIASYDNIQARHLTPKQMSTMIAIFGGLSLPPQSPRIYNPFVAAIGPQPSTHWDFVNRLVEDKEKWGYQLSDGDRYWVMWANLAVIQRGRDGNSVPSDLSHAVETATRQVEYICPRTKEPDLLAPYFNALLDHGASYYLSNALIVLCDILLHHRNIHSALITVVWRFFLLDPDKLSAESQNRLLSVLWSRAQIHPRPIPGSRTMTTHKFNSSTKRHERHPIDARHLVAVLASPLFSIYFTPVPVSVSQWAIRTLQASLSPNLTRESKWRNMSLLALCHSFEHRLPGTTSLDCSSSDWDAILTLRTFETVIPKLPDPRTEGTRAMLESLWKRWLDIPGDVQRPPFVVRAFAIGCLRLAGRIGALDICNDVYRHCAQQGLLLSGSHHTKAERFQVEALVKDYAEAFVCAGGGRFTHVLRAISSPSRATLAADIIITLSAFITRDITVAHDLYTHCVRSGIPIVPEVEHRLALELAPVLPSAAVPFLSKYRNELDKLHDLLPPFLCSLLTHRRQYATPTQASIIGDAMAVFFKNTVPSPSLRYPICYTLNLIAPHCPAKIVHLVKVISEQSPAYFSPRFIRNLILLLVRHRYHRLALEVQRGTWGGTGRDREEIREMLFFLLVRRGAMKLAKQCHPILMGKLRELSGTKGHKRSFLRRPTLASVSRSHCRRPDPRLISSLYLSYLQQGRQVSAREILIKAARYMDAKAKTSLGNAFLDFLVSKGKSLYVFNRTRVYLARRVGFVEDRVTLNILIKALLRRRDMDQYQIRGLFDQLVHAGYPVKDQWLRNHGVPFGSPPSSSFPLITPKLPPISFKRHTQPLYKMFIKAFHLRKDIVAAKTVIGILKAEEVAFLMSRKRVD